MSKQTIASRSKQLLKATQSAAAEAQCWEDVHNRIFGVGALMSQLFPSSEERVAFSKQPAYGEIRKLIESLPGRDNSADDFSGKVSLRLPKSLHAALTHEAESEGVSLNQLLVAKLSAQLRDVAHV